MNINIRTILPNDYPLLKDFLYHAIFVPLGYHITGEKKDHANHEDYIMMKELRKE